MRSTRKKLTFNLLGSDGLQELREHYYHLVRAVNLFKGSMPPVNSRSSLDPALSRYNFPCATDPILVEVFIMNASAALLLHSIKAPEDTHAYLECLTAAHSVADMVSAIDDRSIKYLNAISIGVSKICYLSKRRGGSLMSVFISASTSHFCRPSGS